MINKNHEKHLERLCKLARNISSSKKKNEEFFKLVGIHDQNGNLSEPYKTEEILTEGGNTKEFLKLKEEHTEMLELLKDIYDTYNNGEYPSEYDYDDIKELLDRILLNE